MAFVGSGALLAGVAVAAAGAYSANQQSKAANKAANAQTAADQAAIGEQNNRFDQVRQLLAPYVTAGNGALTSQQNLLGVNGNAPQQQAIDSITNSPIYTSALTAGNRNILSNASATGGLRGGNTQAALGQFAPQLLAQIIQQQYGNLAGMSSLGENAAAGTGNAAMQTGNNVSQLLVGQGNAQAGDALAQGKAQTGYANALSNAIGMYFGYGYGGGGGARVPGMTNTNVPAGGGF